MMSRNAWGGGRGCLDCEGGLAERVIGPKISQLRTSFDLDINLLSHLREKGFLTAEEEEPMLNYLCSVPTQRIKANVTFWKWVEPRNSDVLECIIDYLEEHHSTVYPHLIGPLREALVKARLEARSKCSNCSGERELMKDSGDDNEYSITKLKQIFQQETFDSSQTEVKSTFPPSKDVDLAQTEVKQLDSVDGYNLESVKDLKDLANEAGINQESNKKRYSEETYPGDLLGNTIKSQRVEPVASAEDSGSSDNMGASHNATCKPTVMCGLDLGNRVLLQDLKHGYPAKGNILFKILSIGNYWPSGTGFDFYIEDSTGQRRCICFHKELLPVFKSLENKTVYLAQVPKVILAMSKENPDEVEFSNSDIPMEVSAFSAGECPPDRQMIREVKGHISSVSLLKEFMACTRCKRYELVEDHSKSAPYRCPGCDTQSKEKGVGYKVRIRIKADCNGDVVELGMVTSYILNILGVSKETFTNWSTEQRYDALNACGPLKVTYFTKTMTPRIVELL